MDMILKNQRENGRFKITDIAFWGYDCFYRVFIIMLFILFFASALYAGERNSRIARQVAYNFCLQHGKSSMLTKGPSSLILLSEHYGAPDIHIFNIPQQSGYVIVSGDDVMKPILAYSFYGTFVNPGSNTRAWLKACQGLIDRARAERCEPSSEVLGQWSTFLDDEPGSMESSGESIPTLMSTRWNQGEFYNDSCPYDPNSYTHALTGCVATALAQVMAYWQRPVMGNGSHTYTHALYGSLSANFGNTYYDWNHMSDIIDEHSSPAEIRAQAQLVYHCGVAVDMGYGPDGSSAFVVNYGDTNFPSTENALKQYFRYKSALHSIFEDNMSSSQWLDSIKKELILGRPVPYAGYMGSGGHAFVIDGLDLFDRVHVNWGWGGLCDGYYELTPLPAYSLGCQAIVCVEPSDKLYCNKRFFEFGGRGGIDSLLIFTNESNVSGWTAYSTRGWITVTPTSGNGAGSSARITITVDTNDTEQNRSGNVIVRQGDDSIFIAIIQYGYSGEDQIMYGDDTIYMDSIYHEEMITDTIYPGYHYTIYSPGGPSGYPSPVTSRLHLVAAQRSNLIMQVDYDIEQDIDYLRIFDSEDESIQLTNWTGTGSVDRLVCFSGHACINFHSDGYNPGTGFAIHVYACDTFETEVRNVISVVSGTNTINLRWIDTSQADMWRIRWGTDPRNLDQYREVLETQTSFTGLDLENNNYFFRVWNNINGDTSNLCQAHLHGCFPQDGLSENCPGSTIKDIEIVQLLNHSITLRWKDKSIPSDEPLRWHVRYGENRNNLCDSAFTDTNQITLTGLRNGAVYYYRIYNNTLSHDSASLCFLMKIGEFETLRCLFDSMDIQNVQTFNVTQNSVDLSWQDLGGGTYWWVDVRMPDTMIRYQTDTSYLRVSGLDRQHSYDYVIYNNAGQTDTLECQQWHTLATICDETLESCINFTDFTSCLVEPWIGSYNNPFEGQGAVDYGENDPGSRHTVIHTNGIDPNTDGLTMVPQGEIASVRLGNALSGYQAEALSYLYYVDTTAYDLLLLKYAAVLENPNHTPDEQPRMTMRIMNADGTEIDDSCYFFDFVSDSALGWNVHGHVLWKDWTTVGVDLSPLHGRRIKVEIATYDCNQGNHFGYAYFVLRCDRKEVFAELCGNSMNNVFHAPEGFIYRWYEINNPQVTLSTTSSLTVDTAGSYRCVMSPIGNNNSNCSFEMKCYAGYRYPFSVANISFTDSVDCRQRVLLSNGSYVTSDEEHTIATEETISNIQWILPGDSTSTSQSVSLILDTGVYTVRLVSYLSNGACTDTLQLPIHVTPVCPVLDTLHMAICEGDSILFYGSVIRDSGLYDFRDGMYWHTLKLDVKQTTYGILFDTIVENQLPYSFLDSTFNSDVQNVILKTRNIEGCDSMVDYNLKVWYNTSSVVDTTICPEALPFYWNGQIAREDNSLLVAQLVTSHGADSVVQLNVHVFDALSSVLIVNPTIIDFDNYRDIYLQDKSVGGISRTWFLSDGTVCNDENWTYCYPIPEDSVVVTLVEECEIGCHDTASVTLLFRPTTLYAPTAFMPNAIHGATEEGIARFSIHGANLLQLHVYIYDRRGLLIYEWEGQEGGWDGFYKGTPCPQAGYVWVATYSTYDKPSTLQCQTGSILLLR